MFKLVTGGNGRIIYYGTVSRQKAGAIEIVGKDYNFETKQNEDCAVQMTTPKPDHGLKVGEKVLVMLLPDREKPNFGVAEAIAKEGTCLSLKNDRGNEKVALIGKIHSMKWNDKHNRLSVNFSGIVDEKGNPYGRESVYQDRGGNTRTSYWLNAAVFSSNERFPTFYTAEKADNDLEPGESVMMVLTRKEGEWNGRPIVNFNVAKFEKLNKDEASNSPQTAKAPTQAADKPKNEPEEIFQSATEEEMAVFQ